MSLSQKCFSVLLFFLISTLSFAKEPSEILTETKTYQIGVMVEQLQVALKQRDEEALEIIRLHGTDSRYYSMVRGWLFQELVGVESQLHASKGKKNK